MQFCGGYENALQQCRRVGAEYRQFGGGI